MKRLLMIGAICILAACDKNDNAPEGPDDPDGQGKDVVIKSSMNAPGIGDNLDKDPLTQPLTLPAGIKIVRRPTYLFNTDIRLLHGNINTFYVDVNIVNETTQTVKVDFPKGLVFIPYVRTSRVQNGMTMGDISISVPPTGPQKDTTTVYFGLACLNKTAGVPYGSDNDEQGRQYPIARDLFKIAGVTTDVNLLDLCVVLKDYPKLKLTQHYKQNDPAPEWLNIYKLIQDNVWEITDYDGIDKEEMAELKAALVPYK